MKQIYRVAYLGFSPEMVGYLAQCPDFELKLAVCDRQRVTGAYADQCTRAGCLLRYADTSKELSDVVKRDSTQIDFFVVYKTALIVKTDLLERYVFYNFHPGSHVGQGVEEGIRQIIEVLNIILKPEQKTTVLLETMSGKGSEVGSRFEELRQIIDGVTLKDKIGVCLDTCHVYDAGYDIVNNLDGVLEEFDRIVGLERLHAIHLNDSKNPFCSHKDRHAKIGEGSIGLEAIIAIINHPKLCHLPFCLETPNELDGYAKEIALLREHYKY